jgi:hypothetical protein
LSKNISFLRGVPEQPTAVNKKETWMAVLWIVLSRQSDGDVAVQARIDDL